MAWTAIDNLDSYSNGDLNGNNGGSNWTAAWSGSVNWDIQGSVVYQGAKAAENINSAGGSISRTFTAISAGSLYLAMRRTVANPGSGFLVSLFSGSTEVCDVGGFLTGGTTRWRILDSNTVWKDISTESIVSGQWYIINIEFDDAGHNNQYRARVYNGTSWSAFTAWYGTTNAYTTVDKIQISCPTSETACYFDIITDTDPLIVTVSSSKLLLLGVS